MSIITAYKSDTDGKIFEDKKRYQAHLRKLAAQRRQDNKLQEAEREFDEFNIRMGQVASIAELEQFIKANWQSFWVNGIKNNAWRLRGKPAVMHECVDIKFDLVRWKDHISNSWVCPRNGVTNWCNGDKSKPSGYPGWYGRIKIKVRPPLKTHRGKSYLDDGWGSDYFANTVICTGSGGGGGSHGTDYVRYEYEVTLWADDFPVMKLMREQSIVWHHLGGELSNDQANLAGVDN